MDGRAMKVAMPVTLLRRVLPPGSGVLFSEGTRWRLVLAAAGAVLVAMLDMLGVAALLPLMQILTDRPRSEGALGVVVAVVGENRSDQWVAVFVSLVMVGAFVLKGVLTICFRWWQLGFLAKEQVRTSSRLMRGYLAAPYEKFTQRTTAELLRTMGDAVGQTYGQVVLGSLSAATEALTILAMVGLLLLTSPGPAALAVAYFAVSAFWLSRVVKRHAAEAGEQVLQESTVAFRAVLHSMGGAKEIMVRRNAETFVGHYAEAQTRLASAKRRFAFTGEFPKYALEIIFVVGVALMTIATFSVEGPQDGLTTLAVFVAAGTRVIPCLSRLMAGLVAVRFGLPGLRLVVDDVHHYVLPHEGERRSSPLDPRDGTWAADIELHDVGFAYEGADQVLSGINVRVPRGTTLAIVGASGAGKTTLVDLLLGLLAPTSGRITVGGRDIREDLEGWQRQIGLVPQLVYIIEDTLRNNVIFGMPADDDRVWDCLRQAHLEEFVRSLPDGLDTELGDRGSRISGGQAQRLGIARALYLRPSVIVLDEATSALDNETERSVSEAMASLHGEVTLVVVAHRLSTVRHADKIVMLVDGEVDGVGTFDELKAASSRFARLVELGRLE
jgi:ABC-type multidrug transport system fused ATPase/permease subunit